MHQKTINRTVPISLHSILLITFSLLLHLSSSAQNYKVGDRVEAKPYGTEWSKATVSKLIMYNGEVAGIVVRMDNEKDDAGNLREYTTSAYNLRHINDAPAQTTNTNPRQIPPNRPVPPPLVPGVRLRVDNNNTVLADRPLINCNGLQKRGRTGDRPDPQLITKLIRCIWEKPSMTGADGATTIDVAPLQIGQPRRWNVNVDEGNDGNANTIIYPVKTIYTMKVFWRTRITIQQFTGVFYCYVNTFGEWTVENHDSRDRTELKEIPVQQ